MVRYALRRVAQVPLLLIVVSAIIFFSLRLGPFSPTALMSEAAGNPAKIAAIRKTWDLDQPLPVQYLHYMGQVVQGNFGRSFIGNEAVSTVILQRLPATIELTVAAIVIGAIFGIGLGIVSAIKRDSPWDGTARGLALTGISVPTFWLGLMLIWVFAVKLHWLPAGGRFSSRAVTPNITGFYVLDGILSASPQVIWDALSHLIMPALVLGLFVGGFLARITRASMIETLGQDYIRTARAKGQVSWRIVLGHALQNALLPILTVLGLQFGLLLGGAAVTETVFSYPGMGQLLVSSITTQDFPQIQASILVLAMTYIGVNLCVDLLYHFVDPRIREAGVGG